MLEAGHCIKERLFRLRFWRLSVEDWGAPFSFWRGHSLAGRIALAGVQIKEALGIEGKGRLFIQLCLRALTRDPESSVSHFKGQLPS